MKYVIYLAGALFSEGEQAWCRHVRDELERIPSVTVNWPFDAVGRLGSMSTKSPVEVQVAIAAECKKGVAQCDVFVMLLDTIPTDDGTAFELGYLKGLGRGHVPVLGLRTDAIRQYGDNNAPLNAMVGAHIDKLCTTVSELKQAIREVV